MNTTHTKVGTVSVRSGSVILEDGSLDMATAAHATVEVRLCGRGSSNGAALNRLGQKIDCLIDGINNIPEPPL